MVVEVLVGGVMVLTMFEGVAHGFVLFLFLRTGASGVLVKVVGLVHFNPLANFLSYEFLDEIV
jgi:hypothetical protein